MPIHFLRRNALIGLISFAAPLHAQDAPQAGNAGAYLAAMVAAAQSDYLAADTWYLQALKSDPANSALLEGAMISALSLGDIPRAAAVAEQLRKLDVKSQNIALALLANDALNADYAAILAGQKQGQSAGVLMDDLAGAWANVGLGHMSDALAQFDKIIATQGLEGFGLYHKALALAQAGDFGGADDILSGRAAAGTIALSRRGVIAHAQILSQLEKTAEAAALLTQRFDPAVDPEVAEMLIKLKSAQAVPMTGLLTAQDGLAEAFASVAIALNGETDDAYTLLHARIASALRPTDAQAILLTASLLERQNQHDLATAVYAQIPETDPAFTVAEIGRADATFAAGHTDAGLEILAALARAHGENLDVLLALGNGQRRTEKFGDATKTYDAAVALLQKTGADAQPSQWPIYYARGISHEKQGEFDLAETDMRRALALDPNQPQVLNYLGYSLVDRGKKLPEALGMIERAVAAQPDSGYILDSLAWAYYRLGRYTDALMPMENASLLEPVDPIVTDHLGDVYWANGRTREAEFQWSRALSFSPTDADAARIHKKLELGLDAVLATEGAPPLTAISAKND